MGAWYCLFTGVGEWVLSSENGTKSKVETQEGVNQFKWKVMCVGRRKKGAVNLLGIWV